MDDLHLGAVQGQRARLLSLVLGLLRWERDGVEVDGECSCKEGGDRKPGVQLK